MAPPGSAHFAALRAKKRKAAAGAQSKVSTTGHPTVSESGVSRPATRRRKERRLGALDWHNIALPSEIGFDDAGGLLELDEVEGVNVVYGTDGRVSFQVSFLSFTPWFGVRTWRGIPFFWEAVYFTIVLKLLTFVDLFGKNRFKMMARMTSRSLRLTSQNHGQRNARFSSSYRRNSVLSRRAMMMRMRSCRRSRKKTKARRMMMRMSHRTKEPQRRRG